MAWRLVRENKSVDTHPHVNGFAQQPHRARVDLGVCTGTLGIPRRPRTQGGATLILDGVAAPFLRECRVGSPESRARSPDMAGGECQDARARARAGAHDAGAEVGADVGGGRGRGAGESRPRPRCERDRRVLTDLRFAQVG